jgi:hypothetical protein
MSYTITVGAGYIVKTPASGIPVVVNSANVVTEGGIESIRKVSVPVSVATPTGYTYYVDFYIVLNLVDGREETIYMASVTNQPTWTNDLAGVNTAIADIYGSFVNGGGGGGGQVNSVVAGTGITVDNTDPVNPVVNAGLKHIMLEFTQFGTDDPTINIFQNTTGLTLTASRNGVGEYFLEFSTPVSSADDIMVIGLGGRQSVGFALFYSDDLGADVRVNHSLDDATVIINSTDTSGASCEFSMEKFPIIIYIKNN